MEKEIKTVKPVEPAIPAWAKELQEKVNTLSKENEMLKDMAGKNAIASYQDGKKPAELKKAHFRKFNGKLVVGWGSLDYSNFNPSAKDGLRENILTELIYEDGSREKVNYILFNNTPDREFLPIINEKGDLTTVLMPDGKELTVETRFLNR